VNGNFVWRDAGRTVVFEAGGIAAAPKLLAEHGMEQFELLTTRRHLDGGEGLAAAATAVHELPPPTRRPRFRRARRPYSTQRLGRSS